MKTKEMIQEEYKLFNNEFWELVSNYKDVNGFINNFGKDLEEDERDLVMSLKENKVQLLKAKIINLVGFLEEDIESYKEENKYIEKELEVVKLYKKMLKKMQEVLNEENFQEIFKLFDFTIISYGENINFWEAKRDRVICAQKGIMFIDNSSISTMDSFKAFFEDEISQISLIKPVEKIKK